MARSVSVVRERIVAFAASEFVTVVAKLASSPNAVASSFNVFKAAGAESTKLVTAAAAAAAVAATESSTYFLFAA